MGDTPGVLDAFINNPILQAMLGFGTQARFGVDPLEKYRMIFSGAAPGFPGMVPSTDVDQAQRALSVALGSRRFGPGLPMAMSAFSVDNPAAANPMSAQATADALGALASGSFQPPAASMGTNITDLLLSGILPGYAGMRIGGSMQGPEDFSGAADVWATLTGKMANPMLPAAPAAPQPPGGMTSQDPSGMYAQLWQMLNRR